VLHPDSLFGSDSFRYEFHTDGTYRRLLFSDVFPPPEERGTWKLTRDADRRRHLLLAPDDGGDCYWLACDSIVVIRGDRLIVIGKPYVGEQSLEHTPAPEALNSPMEK
jgi:hypothetical protein